MEPSEAKTNLETTVPMNTDTENVEETLVESEQVVPQENVDDTLMVSFDEIVSQLDFLYKEIRNVNNQVKTLKKTHTKVLKSLRKKKKRNVDPNRVKREPSGFVSPILISDELADFLGEEKGAMFPRTVVTKRIVTYIKENNLGNKTNGRMFDLTDTDNEKVVLIRNLLGVEDGNEVGYFNLQTYLKRHFISKKKLTDLATQMHLPQTPPPSVESSEVVEEDSKLPTPQTVPVAPKKKKKVVKKQQVKSGPPAN
ncbi:hypothetical protein [Heterosigma akashiwo virus 01]|jgi:chromatin remodeling complex protein RSC6|uniref:DM2 domain-containing protein n=1 Tax=Heterosigma akashiwo virus 01 TaxID=97195 RepID=A0A1C9C513_HAV01|nr:hypothetical protein D1R72_gp047 [Heterosigma akashiwo virus 01]AOM63378.1 hypothetical protein [Heterosigma akashiwo virus 01]